MIPNAIPGQPAGDRTVPPGGGQPTAPAPAPAAPATAPAAPAPAPAPGTTPADLGTPAPAPAPVDTPAPAPVKYEATGDTALDVALEFFAAQGFNPEHPAMVAADGGDFGPLKAALKEKGTPGAASQIKLAEEGYARLVAKERATVEANIKAVYDAAGGEAEWNLIRSWAATAATEAERTAATAGLKQGGLVATAVVEYLKTRFERSGARTKTPAPTTATASPGAVTSSALSPREYAAAAQTARMSFRGPGAWEDSAVYRDLQSRRRAYTPS